MPDLDELTKENIYLRVALALMLILLLVGAFIGGCFGMEYSENQCLEHCECPLEEGVP
jgi:hypothetical protein